MFALSFMMMLMVAFISTFNLKNIAVNSEVKNFSTSVMLISSTFVSLFVFFFFYQESVWSEIKSLLSDYRILFSISLEILGLYVARKNYEINGDNVTAINLCMFLSLVFVPVIAFCANDLFGFTETIVINYQSSIEFIIFISLMLLLICAFFADKLKGHINSWGLLLLTPVLMSHTMFFTGKLMQTHNPYLVSAVVSLSSFFIYGTIAFLRKEYRHVNRTHKKAIGFLSGSALLFVPLNAIAVSIVAIEFVTLLKRIAQIICGVAVDRVYGNHGNLRGKDYIIIFMMFASGMLLYILRG